MKVYRIELKKSAEKGLESLPGRIRVRVWSEIEALARTPRPLGCRKMTGTEKDRYRIRVGDYRVIYNVYDDRVLIIVLDVGHRKEIYRKR